MKVIKELVREGLLIQSRGPITLYNFTTADYTQLSLLLVFKICKLKLVEGGPFPRYCRVGAVPGPSRGWHAVLIQAVGVGERFLLGGGDAVGGASKHLIWPHVSHMAEGHRSWDFPWSPFRAGNTDPQCYTWSYSKVKVHTISYPS